MALYTDPQWNQRTGRPEMHFVNQQYDLILRICWDEAERAFCYDQGIERAQAEGQFWRPGFDAEQELKQARKRLGSMKPPK